MPQSSTPSRSQKFMGPFAESLRHVEIPAKIHGSENGRKTDITNIPSSPGSHVPRLRPGPRPARTTATRPGLIVRTARPGHRQGQIRILASWMSQCEGSLPDFCVFGENCRRARSLAVPGGPVGGIGPESSEHSRRFHCSRRRPMGPVARGEAPEDGRSILALGKRIAESPDGGGSDKRRPLGFSRRRRLHLLIITFPSRGLVQA